MPFNNTKRISELTTATPAANDVVPGSLASGSTSRKFTCGSIAALAPVASVAGRTGAVTIGHTDVVDFDAQVAVVAATVAPVVSVVGRTGAVTVGHTDVVGFDDRVAVIAATAGGGGGGDVESVNGLTGAVSLNATSIGAAPSSHGSQHARTGSDSVPLIIGTQAALTQNEDDYDLGASDVVYITAATTNRDITGITGGATGSVALVINSGATYSIALKHASTASTDASRILVPWEGDYVLSAKGGAALVLYDTTESRWRVV